MKLYIPLIGAFIVAGCVTNPSVPTNSLSANDRNVVQRIQELVKTRCIRYTYDRTTGERKSGNMKIHGEVVIKKLFRGEKGWFKAEALSDGVWGDVYLNTQSNAFVCGSKTWEKTVGSEFIKFVDATQTPETFFQQDSPQQRSEALNETTRKLVVNWKSVATSLFDGQVRIRGGDKNGTVSVSLPGGAGSCTGVYEYTSSDTGTWAMTCTNGRTAGGKLAASSGAGKDDLGNPVSFIIGD
jgi:hypothetical protein